MRSIIYASTPSSQSWLVNEEKWVQIEIEGKAEDKNKLIV